jgi:putative restriction endonuclease
MGAPQQHWVNKLARLNPAISRAAGEGAARYAPHKPLLLLALLDSAEAGEIIEPRLTLSAGLRLRFNALWQIVFGRWTTKPNPTLPFHHLSTQGFWRALREDGTQSKDPRSTRLIELDPGFFALIQSPDFRRLARVLLVTTWFPPAEQLGLATTLGIDLVDTAATSVVAEARAVYRAVGRDARFRIQVVVQYHYTCALTGYTLTTDTGTTMVEAAHIAAFARTRNNDPQNGLALTPDAHWSFDEGLWTVDDQYRVIVLRDRFTESSPAGALLARRHGQPLFFHSQSRLRPSRDQLAEHRASVEARYS